MELLKKRWGKEWIKQKRNSQIICTPSAFKRDTYDAKRRAGIDAIETFNKIISQESQFPIIINHKYEIKITENITLTGTWEYVREIERNGQPIIQLLKFKTDNNRFNINHQTRHDLELTAAMYAFEQSFNASNVEVIYVDIYKKKLIPSYRSEKDFNLLKETVISVAKSLKYNIRCTSPDKKCYHCEYRDVCAEKLGGNDMSMKLGISGGSMEITDTNETIVSGNVAKEIQDNYVKPDTAAEDKKSPELTVKD